MKNEIKKINISIIAPLLILLIFSICILFVLLFGTKLYKTTLNRDRNQFEIRTVNQYIQTRIRQGDGDGMMFIGDFDTLTEAETGNTLFLVEVINGIKYYTRIYCYEGYLYELFSAADIKFEKEDGEKILPLKDIEFKTADNTVITTVTYLNEEKYISKIALRSSDGKTDE